LPGQLFQTPDYGWLHIPRSFEEADFTRPAMVHQCPHAFQQGKIIMGTGE
jgi:hypothetical protein